MINQTQIHLTNLSKNSFTSKEEEFDRDIDLKILQQNSIQMQMLQSTNF